ncbi:hypothetical protein GCK72_004557 [Caenorhabditis remanei]|uniref:Uncharacterized protein n=1 Tax=Caenorhabditis remanei TaxID=31234 RepID=A0A6A5HA26_CAERE|nr:hypothetical protein GCK72_004557 [Caenorhabditis remanei]KAF1764608.1 hypothetical protein GCK72_004557 [Caenorhabditis remanei]
MVPPVPAADVSVFSLLWFPLLFPYVAIFPIPNRLTRLEKEKEINGGAIEHYSQNETAHFMRAQKANEPLFFDRGNIQHHRPEKLLRGKQLAETLEDARARKMEEKQQLDKHPQDRENKDQEVNEQPDQGEQDYKEH